MSRSKYDLRGNEKRTKTKGHEMLKKTEVLTVNRKVYSYASLCCISLSHPSFTVNQIMMFNDTVIHVAWLQSFKPKYINRLLSLLSVSRGQKAKAFQFAGSPPGLYNTFSPYSCHFMHRNKYLSWLFIKENCSKTHIYIQAHIHWHSMLLITASLVFTMI